LGFLAGKKMQRMTTALDRLHAAIGRSPLLLNLAIKIRNQTNAIVGKGLSDGIRQATNGEELVMRTIRSHCHSFVDVGANLGGWTASFVSGDPTPARGTLIEPNPVACEILRSKFKDTPYQIVEAAAGPEFGAATFFVQDTVGETSSLVRGATARVASSITVTVRPVDEILKDLGYESVDFLKIDAEGYDFHVLVGARSLIENQRVKFVQFEYNAPWALAGATLGRAGRFFDDAGYKLFLIKKSGLHELDYAKYGDYFRYSNFLAVRRDCVAIVANIIGPSL
jgi:FkbM family methyltransferase